MEISELAEEIKRRMFLLEASSPRRQVNAELLRDVDLSRDLPLLLRTRQDVMNKFCDMSSRAVGVEEHRLPGARLRDAG